MSYCIVRPGDTLSEIAYRELGDAGRCHEIYELNKDMLHAEQWRRGVSMGSSFIFPGQVLKLPTGPSSTATPSSGTESPTASLVSTLLNSTLNAIVNSDLPRRQGIALQHLCTTLQLFQSHAPASPELREHLAAISVAAALLSLSPSTASESSGPKSPSPKGSPNPTSAPTGGAPAGETGAPPRPIEYTTCEGGTWWHWSGYRPRNGYGNIWAIKFDNGQILDPNGWRPAP
jgi:hypothetical protein